MNPTNRITNVATKNIPQWQKNYIRTKIFAHRIYVGEDIRSASRSLSSKQGEDIRSTGRSSTNPLCE